MNRQEFEARNREEWQSFEADLEIAEKGKAGPGEVSLPSRFRKICYDLSLAQYRMFGHQICDRLNGLAIRGYRLIHRKRGGFGEATVDFVLRTFPQTVRREWRLFALVSLVFWLPFFVMWGLGEREIQWVQAFLGAEQMASIEQMYGKDSDTAEHLREEHGSNFMMFAFYIQNNVGIDFRIFAGGIFFGIGTLFYLLFNGLYFGAVIAYVEYVGEPELLWSFVAGHSSFELLGFLVVGMAGLKIGLALLSPGQLSRAEALSKAGREALPLLIGGAAMTVLAAVVEGFWSAQAVATKLKYAVGITFWLLHGFYFTSVGRGTAWSLRK